MASGGYALVVDGPDATVKVARMPGVRLSSPVECQKWPHQLDYALRWAAWTSVSLPVPVAPDGTITQRLVSCEELPPKKKILRRVSPFAPVGSKSKAAIRRTFVAPFVLT